MSDDNTRAEEIDEGITAEEQEKILNKYGRKPNAANLMMRKKQASKPHFDSADHEMNKTLLKQINPMRSVQEQNTQ